MTTSPTQVQVRETQQIYLSPNPKAPGREDRGICPNCGKDVALTKTGLVWTHDSRSPSKSACVASGRPGRTTQLSGKALVDAARELAYLVHRADKDKTNHPYRDHLNGVAIGTWVLAGDVPELQAAAYLHDAIEDHPTLVNAQHLAAWGYPERVVKVVEAVSKHNQEKQEDYLERVVEAGEDAMYVKLADLLNNTRPDRMAGLADYQRPRLLKKYTPFKARLMLELGIIQTPEGQELATKPVGTANGTFTNNTDGSLSVSPQSLIKGDWPAGWPSPIALQGDTRTAVVDGNTVRVKDYLLEDGTTVCIATDCGNLKVFTPTARNASTFKAKHGADDPSGVKPYKDGQLPGPSDHVVTQDNPLQGSKGKSSKPGGTKPGISAQAELGFSDDSLTGSAAYDIALGYDYPGYHGHGFDDDWDMPTKNSPSKRPDGVFVYDPLDAPYYSLNEAEALDEAEGKGKVVVTVEGNDAPYSVCGTCGNLTVQSGALFVHAKPTSPYHQVTRPTRDRMKKLHSGNSRTTGLHPETFEPPFASRGEDESVAEYVWKAVTFLLEMHELRGDTLNKGSVPAEAL